MNTPLFSIIIPVYNGQNVVSRALDSIYSQGLPNDAFEVICIDDCSPTMDTYEVLSNYIYNEVHPVNLKVFRHEVNKRQGGARNTGLDNSSGEWILYLDADDYFAYRGLFCLYERMVEYSFCDMIVFDNIIITSTINSISQGEGKQVQQGRYSQQGLKSTILSGKEFMKNFPVSWAPWGKAYKRSFLLCRRIRFIENARFEDIDYSIRTTISAAKVVFIPLIVYCYVCVGGSTVSIGRDSNKIEEYLKASVRVKDIIEEVEDEEVAKSIMGHYDLMMGIFLGNILWRMSYAEIVRLLEYYPLFNGGTKRLINFTYHYPHLYAIFAQIAKPILLTVIWTRNKLKSLA